jgi:hypothetical protein
MHACVRAYLFFGRFTGVRRKGQFEGGISCDYPSIRLSVYIQYAYECEYGARIIHSGESSTSYNCGLTT